MAEISEDKSKEGEGWVAPKNGEIDGLSLDSRTDMNLKDSDTQNNIDASKESMTVFEAEAMKKVMDIDQEGVAYSRFGGDNWGLDSVLSHGLLGVARLDENSLPKDSYKTMSMPEHWAATIRTGRNFVYCNIVGRDISAIKYARWGFPGLIFDLSSFEEGKPVARSEYRQNRGELGKKFQRERTYFPYSDSPNLNPFYDDRKRDESGRFIPNSQDGYAITPRVAPRLFRGIVLKPLKTDEDEELLNTILSEMKEVYREKPDLFLPIYDKNGNLLWPKRMTSDEIKTYLSKNEAQENSE